MNFQFLVVKFSIYLNRRVFGMPTLESDYSFMLSVYRCVRLDSVYGQMMPCIIRYCLVRRKRDLGACKSMAISV